jgi:TolB-like protein
MLALAFTVALATTTTTTPTPTTTTTAAKRNTLLVLDLSAEGVKPELAHLLAGEVVSGLSQLRGWDVLSAEDVRRTMSVEAEREAAGCTADSCIAQMGQAMGARYVVHGDVGVVGGTTVVHLNLFDTQTSRGVARESGEAHNDDELLGAVRAAVARIRDRVTPPVAASPDPGLATGTLVGGGVAGVGGLIALIGGVGAGLSVAKVYDLDASPEDRKGAQNVGAVSTAVGAGGLVVAAVGVGLLLLWSSP